MKRSLLFLVFATTACAITPAITQVSKLRVVQPEPVFDPARALVARGFGIFVHFGLETFANVEYTDGTAPAASFAPSALTTTAIDGWIAAAQSGGAKYVVLTSKHHSGFCLWPTSSTTYDVAATSWYATGFDIVAEFTARCRAAGLGVGLYFSPWDKHWEAGHDKNDGTAYATFLKSQLTELLTNYGQIDYLWLDGWGWSGPASGSGVPFSVLPYDELYSHIKSLQRSCLVMVNNHEFQFNRTEIVGHEFPGGDGLPPEGNTKPSETCDTIQSDGKWFWGTSGANTALSAATLISRRSACNSRNAAYLLNVPPDSTGAFPAAYITRLTQLAP